MQSEVIQPQGQSSGSSANLNELFSVMTANYRPPTGAHVPFLFMGLPPLTIEIVDVMKRDPQVKIGMAIKSAPLLKPKFEIKGRPDIVEFVAKMLRVIWTKAIPEVIQGMWFTRAAMEVVYKRNQQSGQVWFDCVKPIYPGDARVLTRDGNFFGLRVPVRENGGYGDAPANNDSVAADRAAARAASGDNSNVGGSLNGAPGVVNLLRPKSLLYVHRREFGSWQGQSEFEGAYDPWLEKCGIKGAKDIRKMWMYKNAYHSGILFHPPGTFTDPTDAAGVRKIPYRDLARQAIEGAQTGQTWTFDNVFDPETKQRLWEFVPPAMNGNAKDILEYPKELDRDILHGLEIPDDIISQVSGSGGGFAGRTIPLMSFFLSQNLILQAIVAVVKEQILDPLCMINFGSMDYEIQDAEINVDALMPTPPGQGNAAGGMASGGDVAAEGDDLAQADGGKVSDAQDVNGQPGGKSGSGKPGFGGGQQKQLSQGVIEAGARVFHGDFTANVVTVEIKNWKSRTIQLSQGNFDESKHPRDPGGEHGGEFVSGGGSGGSGGTSGGIKGIAKTGNDAGNRLSAGQRVKFHSGEHSGKTVTIESIIPMRYNKSEVTYRGRIDGVSGGKGEVIVTAAHLSEHASLSESKPAIDDNEYSIPEPLKISDKEYKTGLAELAASRFGPNVIKKAIVPTGEFLRKNPGSTIEQIATAIGDNPERLSKVLNSCPRSIVSLVDGKWYPGDLGRTN